MPELLQMKIVRCWSDGGVECHLPECQIDGYCWERESLANPRATAGELATMYRRLGVSFEDAYRWIFFREPRK
jgi:hypothetical protein